MPYKKKSKLPGLTLKLLSAPARYSKRKKKNFYRKLVKKRTKKLLKDQIF